MKLIRGGTAYSVRTSLFDFEEKEIIKSIPDKDVMFDFDVYDTQDEKDALWGGY